MDALHTMLRSLKGERKSQPDRRSVFRAFLAEIERSGRRAPTRRAASSKRKACTPRAHTS